MIGFIPQLTFVYRGPRCPGFRSIRFDEFVEDIREANPKSKWAKGGETARKALNLPMVEDFEKKLIVEQDLANEFDMSMLINQLCSGYSKNGYELRKTFDTCALTRNGNKQVLPIRWGYENYDAIFEIVYIYHIVALYEYSRLIDIEAHCRRPTDYYYAAPINYSVPKYHIGGVWLQAARSEAVLAYHSGYDKFEPGVPDGLLIEVEFKQDARLRKNKQGEVSRGFFDFWPEIPAIAQPSEPIEGNTIHRASYANEALVLKNPEKGKKHIEFCKAFQYPEAYYRFGLSFKNSITGEELVFPETFIRLHVFNTNV
jgi:hypothetical protein